MRIILISILISLLGCALLGKQRQLEIVEMHSSGEVVQSKSGKKDTLERTCRIVYDQEFRLYMESTDRYRPNIIIDSNGKPVMGKSIHDTVYIAYAFIAKAKAGLKYEISKAGIGLPVKFDVDSMIEIVGYDKSSFRSFNIDLGKPTEVVKNGKKVVEKYLKKKAGILDADSIFKYYDEDWTDVKFTFSPKLDSIKKSKLYKILYIFNPIPKGVVADFAVPRREMFYEFRLVHDKDPSRYQKIIDTFKTDSKTKFAAVPTQ